MKFEIKAAALLAAAKAEAERQSAILLAEQIKNQLRVPVTMKGVLVGFGDIHTDGSMTVDVEKNPAGEELMQMIRRGTANCLSLGPNPDGPTATILSED